MNEPQEEWKPIPGYNGTFEVSTHGRVRKVKQYFGEELEPKIKPLKTHQRMRGGLHVHLTYRGVRKTKSVKQLMSVAFDETGQLPPIIHDPNQLTLSTF